MLKADIYHDPPVSWGAMRLERAGFHDSRHNGRTAFEGAPDPQNDAAWSQLLTGKCFPALVRGRMAVRFD